MKKFAFSLILILFLILFLVPSVSLGQVPPFINFQGVLKDDSDALLNGNYKMTFSIYNSETEVNPVWQEVYDETTELVPVNNGLYSVQLGSLDPVKNPISPGIFDGQTKYLGVKVGDDPDEMFPRVAIVTVPYAFRAVHADTAAAAGGNADTLGGLSPESYVRFGTDEAQVTDEIYGLKVSSRNSSGIGAWGESIENVGVQGTSSIGAGVVGKSTNAIGVKGHGVLAGVYGDTSAATGKGVHGLATDTSGVNYGVYGESKGIGKGVYGESVSGIGVEGKSNDIAVKGVGNYGVKGEGSVYGGHFEATTGYGVYGKSTYNDPSLGIGGYFESDHAAGLYGSSIAAGDITKAFKVDWFEINVTQSGKWLSGSITSTAIANRKPIAFSVVRNPIASPGFIPTYVAVSDYRVDYRIESGEIFLITNANAGGTVYTVMMIYQ